MSEDDDVSQLDDPEFLAERVRIRELLEHTPAREVDPGLTARYQRLNDEFVRRARLAWSGRQ
jgi:hypothetical protein